MKSEKTCLYISRDVLFYLIFLRYIVCGVTPAGGAIVQDLAVVPLLVAIPLLAGGGGGVAAALTSAATKAAIALGLIAFIGMEGVPLC